MRGKPNKCIYTEHGTRLTADPHLHTQHIRYILCRRTWATLIQIATERSDHAFVCIYIKIKTIFLNLKI